MAYGDGDLPKVREDGAVLSVKHPNKYVWPGEKDSPYTMRNGSVVAYGSDAAKTDREARILEPLTPKPIDRTAEIKAAGESAVKQTKAVAKAAMDIADANLKRYPKIVSTALDLATATSAELDAYLKKQFNSTLDELAPGWREQIIQPAVEANQRVAATSKQYAEDVFPTLAGQMASRAESYLKGEIPEDVSAQLRQTAAESSAGQGLFGQAAGGRVARDFGLTSLDMVNQGAQMANNMNAFYGSGIGIMQQPIASGTALTNLLSAYRAPITDAASMFNNMTAQMTGSSTVSPNSVLATGAQIYDQNLTTGTQIAQYNSDMRWNAAMSAVNMYADRENSRLAVSAGNKQSQNDSIGSIIQLSGVLASYLK